MAVPRFAALFRFLSTPSARRATWPDDAVNYCTEFLSTPSARRATGDASGVQRAPVISIHALREEGDAAVNDLLQRHNISIHALREEGDPFRHRSERVKEDFYPRPPRGGRHQTTLTAEMYRKFLSTPSARRATRARPSRENRPEISIHALREEGDPFSAVRFWLQKVFLSTPSARRATLAACAALHADAISIHALREEGDTVPSSETTSVEDFYPRPPRGGRPPVGTRKAACHELFLSTPSARRTTVSVSPEAAVLPNFYPRPPRGGRRAVLPGAELPRRISIHALREEGDLYFWPFVSR